MPYNTACPAPGPWQHQQDRPRKVANELQPRRGSRVLFPVAVTPSLLRKWTLSDGRKMNGYRVYFSAQSGVTEAASERNLSGFLTFLNSYKVEQEKWPF